MFEKIIAKQKQILLDEIKNNRKDYERRMRRIFKVGEKVDFSDIGKHDLAKLFWENYYEDKDKELELMLTHFEQKYERHCK